jgi:predicted nucleic acid-binding protein
VVIDSILDTSIVIDLLRGFQRAKQWLERLEHPRVSVTPIVWMETVQGATDKAKRAQAVRFLRRFHIEHPTEDDNRWAMRQLARFHLSHGVQLQDAMIASVAARLSVPLYTTNLKHFAPLPAVEALQP